MSAKGYMVRGKDMEGLDVYPEKGTGTIDVRLCVTTAQESAALYTVADEAAGVAAEMMREFDVADVSIYRVAEDGTETPLPTYEEALAEISGADTVLTLVGQPPDGRRLILRITDAMGAAGDMLRGAHAEIARLRTTERPEEKRLREAVAAMRRLLREPEREGIPGFADVCAALDALHRALWGPSGRLADRDAKGAD